MNGHVCCILGVCCVPPEKRDEQVQALADEIEKSLGPDATKTDTTTGNAYAVAQLVLDNFDLVPKGLGEAVVAAYTPHFAQKFKKS